MAILEALSHGLPCLVTPGSNMSDYIDQYNCGMSVDFNIITIGNMLKEIIEYGLFINDNEVSKNCVSLVQQQFSIKDISARMMAIYKNMICNKI